MKKITKNIFLSLALLACGVTPLATSLSLGVNRDTIANTNESQVIDRDDSQDVDTIETKFETELNSVKGDNSYVSVGEIWNNDTKTFDKDNIRVLLRYMGLENATLEEVTTKAQSKLRASDIRKVVTNAGVQGDVGYTAKKVNQNINVMLGGLEWTVCYLSTDKSGNPVLTLWLSNSTQDAFKDRDQKEGQHYGYFDGGLYSDWAYNWYDGETKNPYPSAMYGTSYIRAVTLNNGGQYATDTTTLSTNVEQDVNNAFALFTMSANGDGRDLSDYITTPSQIDWQENQSAKTYSYSWNCPNDAWGVQDDTGFYKTETLNCNYSNKEGYDTWKEDKLWLPSMGEIGWNTSGTQGMWGLNVYQKMNYDGMTVNPEGKVGKSNGVAYTYVWLRSGYFNNANNVYIMYPSGASFSSYNVVYSIAVRPALHLNLSNIIDEEEVVEISFNTNGGNDIDNMVVYQNEKYLNLPTPIKENAYFDGWYLDSGLSQKVTSSTIVTNSTNHTLYAKWSDAGYTIDYKETIKTGDTYSTPSTLTNDLPNNLSITSETGLQTLTKQGYIFRGWRFDGVSSNAVVKVQGEEKSINDGQIYLNESGGMIYFSHLAESGSVTITAVWERDKDAKLVTYKTYEDYFIDNDITQDTTKVLALSQTSLKEEEINSYQNAGYDLVNCGDKTYYILTQKGFMFLTNYSISKISLANKNLELLTDIVLNDERFDKSGGVECDIDGKSLYGDGIVYSWKWSGSGSNFNFNGNGYAVYGMYYNNAETTHFSLFGSVVLNEIKNLNINKTFIRIAGTGAVIAMYANVIENCHVMGGDMIAPSGYAIGVVYQVRKSLYNCSNSMNILGSSSSAGISYSCYSGVTYEGAVNYGNITGGWAVGGIIPNPEAQRVVLRNCENYGTIEGTSHVAGIIGISYNGIRNYDLINCVNYGNIRSTTGADCAGIVAYAEGNWNLVNCKNYGIISGGWNSGTLVANIVRNVTVTDTTVRISNCYSYSKMNIPVFCRVMQTNTATPTLLNIDGLIVEYDVGGEMSSSHSTIVSSVALTGTEIIAKNIVVDVKSTNFNQSLFAKINYAKNITLNADCTSFSTRSHYLYANLCESADGVMINIESPTSQVKHYYGTNFRDFYMSWKYGTIGLKTLDGVGSAQGSITTAWLEENGWVKKG